MWQYQFVGDKRARQFNSIGLAVLDNTTRSGGSNIYSFKFNLKINRLYPTTVVNFSSWHGQTCHITGLSCVECIGYRLIPNKKEQWYRDLKLHSTMDMLWEKFQRILPLHMKPISSQSKASVVCSVITAVFIDFCLKKLNELSQHFGKKSEYLNSTEQITRI